MFRGNLAVRAVAAVFAVLSLIETILGAPAAVSALADIGIGGSKYLGPILGAVLVVIFGLIAVGPERVSAWVGRLSRGPSDHLPEALREDDDEPLTLLEAWLEQRIREQRTLARQRAVRGDSWYFAAMGQWDADNVEGLHQGLAPELVARYREHPQDPGHVDGVPPPHGRQEREDYFGRRLDWLERTLRELRTRAARADAGRPGGARSASRRAPGDRRRPDGIHQP